MSYEYRGFEIRDEMIEKLNAYAERHEPIGDFLRAVLENDLQMAVGRADTSNLYNLPAYVTYLYNELPAACWGSPAKVKAWLENAQ
ncbi:MAG TPA: hypothetical protein PLN42_04705 [Anaerolineae bacterium]|jgi:hypothetical protein|nr:hypothetical protein [Anaerolineae bacterium]